MPIVRVTREELLSSVKLTFGEEAEQALHRLLQEKGEQRGGIKAENIVRLLQKHSNMSGEEFARQVVEMFTRLSSGMLPRNVIAIVLDRADVASGEHAGREKFVLGKASDSWIQKDRRRLGYEDLEKL